MTESIKPCTKCKKNAGLLLCGKCGTQYCSKTCQKKHWKMHKPQCGKIADNPSQLSKQVELAIGLKVELRHCGLDESDVNNSLEKMFYQCTKNIEMLASEHSEEGPWNPNYSEYIDKPLFIFRDVCQIQNKYLYSQYDRYQKEIESLKEQKDIIVIQKAYVEREIRASSSIESSLLVELNTKLQEINIKLKKIKSLSKLNSNTTDSFKILLHKIHAIPKCLICGNSTDPPNAVEMCGCENAKYCSRDCRATDWDSHKMTCMAHKA